MKNKSHGTSMSSIEQEKKYHVVFHSIYYCPKCGPNEEGDLYVNDTNACIKQKPYDYFCTRCKRTFRIEEIPTHKQQKVKSVDGMEGS